MIKKIMFFLVSVVFATQALSCALCSLMTPTAHVYLDFDVKDKNLNAIEVTWNFSKNFTDLILDGYDVNGNSKLDEDEMLKVDLAMLDYLKSRNFLMSYEYYDMPDGKTHKLEGKVVSNKSSIVEGRYVFEFKKEVNLQLQPNRILKIVAKDDEGYFNFNFLNYGKKMVSDDLHAIYNSNLGASFIEFKEGTFSGQKQESLRSLIENSSIDEEAKPNFIEDYTLSSLRDLKALFASSANGVSLITIFSIISISFLYGFFHAAGPGHAKLLTTSYFLANGGNYLKSLMFSLKIGVFHVIGALLLVVVSMFGLDFISSSISVKSISLTTKISAVIIVLVSAFLFVDKIKKMARGNEEHDHHCCCASCSGHKTSVQNEWFIAFSAAIIPCPGTILVFVLAFSVGSYALSFLSAIFMAIGMAVVIFLAAVLGFNANKVGVSRFASLKMYVEFLGIFIMLTLGVFMFLISDKLGAL